MSNSDVEALALDTRAPQAHKTAPAVPGMMERRASTIKRRPAPAQERAAHIWQTIQGWNNRPGRPQFEKVALTAATLEKRFGIFRPIAQQFQAEYHAEIAAHAHGITTQAHNRGVPDQVWEILKQRITEVET